MFLSATHASQCVQCTSLHHSVRNSWEPLSLCAVTDASHTPRWHLSPTLAALCGVQTPLCSRAPSLPHCLPSLRGHHKFCGTLAAFRYKQAIRSPFGCSRSLLLTHHRSLRWRSFGGTCWRRPVAVQCCCHGAALLPLGTVVKVVATPAVAWQITHNFAFVVCATPTQADLDGNRVLCHLPALVRARAQFCSISVRAITAERGQECHHLNTVCMCNLRAGAAVVGGSCAIWTIASAALALQVVRSLQALLSHANSLGKVRSYTHEDL